MLIVYPLSVGPALFGFHAVASVRWFPISQDTLISLYSAYAAPAFFMVDFLPTPLWAEYYIYIDWWLDVSPIHL